MKTPTAVKWIAATFARLLMWSIWIIRLPFAITAKLCGEANELLEDMQYSVRNSCPWPWISEFETKWEKATYDERERLIAGLRGEAGK